MNYKNAISDFEKYLEDIYSIDNSYGKEHKGYLINLKDYEKLKEISDNNKDNINVSEKNFRINQIEFKTPQYLINMILNGNKYICINTALWELICDKNKKNESPISYSVNKNNVTFSLDNKYLSFSRNKNIIDEIALNNSNTYKSNYEKIARIIDSAIKYYNFENKILNDLKKKKDSNSSTYDYLVSKDWLDKWKHFSNYENIRTKYLQNNLNNKEDILNDLIYYLEKNKINYNEIPISINIMKFCKKEEIEYYLKKDSLVLINDEFLLFFNCDFSEKLIKYNAFNNKIHIYLDNNEILSFKSNNNIISLDGIINYSNIKQLINLFYFQKKFYNHEIEAKNKVYLINKKVINAYKNLYNYKKLSDFLKSNSNTQSINYDYLNSYDYSNIINELLDNDYIEQFIKIEEKKSLSDFKDIDEKFTELKYKVKFPSEKYLKYIINFEIVDKNIKDFFIENKFAKEEHFISLYYCKCDNEKMLIIFEKDKNNFYEVGHFNDNEDFTIEYLIDDLNKINKYSIRDYFKNGIDYVFKNYSKESQNIINLDNYNKICYYYKIEEINKPKEEIIYQTPKGDSINNSDNNFDIRDNKFVKDIFSILLSLFIFERNILKSSISQCNNFIKSDVILLSNQFLIDFKGLFSYYQVYSILEKLNLSSNYAIDEVFQKILADKESKTVLELISNNEKAIEKYKNKEYFILEKKTFTELNFKYPDNFCILEENTYSKMNKLLNINIETMGAIKYELSFNHGKIVFNPKVNNKNNKFILIYSLVYNESIKDINYTLEIILSFDNFGRASNFFNGMIKSENIFEECSKNKYDFENKYNCKSYLINKTNIREENKNENIELDIKNQKVNKYLSYLIIIHNEYSKIKKEINEITISQSNKPDEANYIINREYMKELENMLHFKEFINEVNIDEIKNLDLDINNINNNDLINKVREKLNEKMVNYLLTLDENKLINNQNKYEISKIEFKDNENNKIYYYNNCQIINKKIYLLLSQIYTYFSWKIKLIKCVLNNNKIIIFSNDKIINSGHLNEDNTFIVEHIIYSNSSNDISQIFKIIKTRGYSFIQTYLSNKRINFNNNNHFIEAKIYSLLGEKETRKEISSKLKTLILLSLFNQKKICCYKSNNTEKVFLMNKDWLFQYQYNEINTLIEKSEKLKDFLSQEDTLNLSIDSIRLNDIISSLDYDSLLKIDDNISKLRNINNIPYKANEKSIKLNNKEITIYTDFVILNENISQIFEKYFSLYSWEYNKYLQHKNGDIIVISKHYQQNSILFGNINYKEYSFNIKYIFDFKHSDRLEKELKYLMKNEIEDYFKSKTLFNEKNDSNNISPIFDNDEEIGYCYKYFSNKQYYNYNNFYDYKNPYLLKAIELYFYFQGFSKKIKETKSDEKEYYLINNNFISEIKINYKYKEIKETLDTINFSNNNNNKILAIKSLSNDIIKYFKDNNKIKNKYEKDFMEPDIIPINDHKAQKCYMIYDKFEILEREMAEDLINGIYRTYGINGFTTIYGKESNYLKCDLNEGKIIIHYPLNFNGNDKYISVIGQLNYENNFLNEYILIYNDSSSQYRHKLKIKGNLNNYLSSLQLYENSEPIIIDESYKEIGIIIKYSNETFNYNSSNPDANKKEIKNDINYNPSNETINNRPQYSSRNNENKLKNIIPYNKWNNSNDEYNLDYQTNTPEIKINFIFPPKIGLQNIGATCYMNATLQCFCHIEKFVNYFKYSQHVISMVRNNKNNLTSSFKLLIEKLWPNNYDESYSQKYYAPEEFKNKISKMNPLFEGIAANDAKDLVNFIIMTLHQELNKAKKRDANNNNIFLDQRNKQIMFDYFAQNFELENQSIINDLFYGINCNITQCCNCNTYIYNYQIYFFLVFPLEEVRKFKNNNFLNNQVNIYDCFDYDRKVNLMFGENSMYCNYCKLNTNCKMCTCLTTGPEILILLLNRGHGIEFNVKINFMEDLDLSNYIEYKNFVCKYKLIGVITHIGESGMGGHFIAYCKDPISKSWNKYNDAIVSKVQNKDFQKEVINFAMPYLLFYQKI